MLSKSELCLDTYRTNIQKLLAMCALPAQKHTYNVSSLVLGGVRVASHTFFPIIRENQLQYKKPTKVKKTCFTQKFKRIKKDFVQLLMLY